MFYKALGFLVWQGGKRYVHRRYGSRLKLAGGGAAVLGIVAAVMVAAVAAKRH